MAPFTPAPGQEVSYFDASFTVGENENFNNIYQQIVNLVPTKEPWINNGYRSMFTQTYEEQGDKNRIFLRCRQGFTQCQSSGMIGNIVDEIVFKGIRYWMTVEDCTKMRVYRQCQIPVDNCGSNELPPVCDGLKKNITRWQDKNGNYKDYFPTTCCSYNKFIIEDWANGEQKGAFFNVILANISCSGINFYVAYYADGRPLELEIGDFVSVQTGAYGGQINYVVNTNVESSDCNLPENAVFFQSPWEGLGTLQNDETVISDPVTLISFPEFGPAIHVATADGFYHLPTSSCEGLPDWYKDTLTNGGGLEISSVFNYGTSGFGFIDNTSHSIFFGSKGWHTFRTDVANRLYIGDKYTDAIGFFSYLILIGPRAIGMISDAAASSRIYELTNDKGYFNRDSFINYEDNFYWISSDKEFYMLDIQPTYTLKPQGGYEYFYKPLIKPLGIWFRTDLKMLRRGVDTATMAFKENGFEIIITNGRDTKILLYDKFYAIWYKWMLPNIGIKYKKDEAYFGPTGIYTYGGEDDVGHPIKQILSFTFGDLSHMVTKELLNMKLALGYNTYITDHNTRLKIEYNLDGRHWFNKFSEWMRMEYPQHIMQIKANPLGNVIKTFQTSGNTIYGSINNYGYSKYKENTLDLEMQQFDFYEPIKTPTFNGWGDERECDDDCTKNNVSKLAHSPLRYSDGTHDNIAVRERAFGVSKYGLIKFNTARKHFNVLNIELMATNGDKLEVGGFLMAYIPADNDTTRIENVYTFGDVEPAREVTPDSGITSSRGNMQRYS